MRTKPLWCALWRYAFTETCDMASRWRHLAGPAFVVHDFASGDISPVCVCQARLSINALCWTAARNSLILDWPAVSERSESNGEMSEWLK